MLQHLSIKNYALIEELDIDLQKGFSVITGETGAGKSILLGAIGLLLGQRADSKAIRTGAQRCVIEAQFDLSEYNMRGLFDELDIDFDGSECILRRELTAAGKSRGFINDTPASVAQLRLLGDHLIDIHSQHQNLLLAQEDFQLNVLDTLAHIDAEVQEYRENYHLYLRQKQELEQAMEDADKSKDEEEYLQFQLQQLQEARLQEGEDQELEEEQKTLEHAEEIKSDLSQASDCLSGDSYNVISSIKNACNQLTHASRVFAPAEELASRLESCLIELKDISAEVDGLCEEVEFNPNRLDFIEERLSTIYNLERKHHVESVAELLQIQEDLQRKVNNIENSDENLEALQQALKKQLDKIVKMAEKLSAKRKKAAQQVEKTMVDTLVPLGIPNVSFSIDISTTAEPGPSGMDHVTFLFSANRNATLQPISQVASGGEIARVMLSLKSIISSAKSLPTIIFDEIDTGVSGQIAERMALIMKEIGQEHNRQVISITHLPQIAALGAQHYKVYKEDNENETNSHIIQLTPEERVEEIAHMLSGSTITEAARDNARMLLSHQ